MYQSTINIIPIAYDLSDCFVDVAIESNTDTTLNEMDTSTPVSIKIIPQLLIPVHDCEVVYYEPTTNINTNITNTNEDRPVSICRSINVYRTCTTIMCAFLFFIAASTFVYHRPGY